ncbi:MAG: hypothetical protein WAW86_07095 [Gammaproteobacteria bacterium]
MVELALTKDLNEIQESEDEEANKEFSYLVSYVGSFGEFTEQTIKFWPMAMRLMEVMNFDLLSLNFFLKENFCLNHQMGSISE